MNPNELLKEIVGDLQSAPAQKILYLEGKSDLPMFFALLGVTRPSDDIHDGILVKGLKDKAGSGSNSVQARLDVARDKKISGLFGMIDGDGEPLATLAKTFDAPHNGPLFTWKAHCIENVLVQTGWPSIWGDSPDWVEVMRRYIPYAALNQIGAKVLGLLNELGIQRHTNPAPNYPLLTKEIFLARLEKSKDKLSALDVQKVFQENVERMEQEVSDLQVAHTLIKGKWLFNHFAMVELRCSSEQALQTWVDHARSVGGLSEVKALWERIRAL